MKCSIYGVQCHNRVGCPKKQEQTPIKATEPRPDPVATEPTCEPIGPQPNLALTR